MKKTKRIIICALILAVALLLSGCIKMHINVAWHEDNSARITMTYGVQKSALEMMGSTEEDAQEQLKESMGSENEGYSFKPYSDSEYTGVIATIDVDDITKDSVDSIDTLRFRCEDNGKVKTYTVSGSFEGSDLAGEDDLGAAGISFDSIDMKIIIDMPGNVTSHNATEKNGSTLTWVLSAAATTSIQATSEVGGGSILLWIILIVLIVLLIGIVVAILMLSKKNKAASQSGSADNSGSMAGVPPYQAPGAYPPPADTPFVQAPPPVYAPPEPQAQAPVYGAPQPQSPVYGAPQPQPQVPVYGAPPPAHETQYQQPSVSQAAQAAAPPYVSTPPATPRCAQCGAELTPGTKFCPVCGATVVN